MSGKLVHMGFSHQFITDGRQTRTASNTRACFRSLSLGKTLCGLPCVRFVCAAPSPPHRTILYTVNFLKSVNHTPTPTTTHPPTIHKFICSHLNLKQLKCGAWRYNFPSAPSTITYELYLSEVRFLEDIRENGPYRMDRDRPHSSPFYRYTYIYIYTIYLVFVHPVYSVLLSFARSLYAYIIDVMPTDLFVCVRDVLDAYWLRESERVKIAETCTQYAYASV